MTEIAKPINREQAKISPEQEFASPQEVINHAGLSRAEKLTILRSWEFVVQSRLDAASEGMAPETDPNIGVSETNDDSELLRKIEKLIAELDK